MKKIEQRERRFKRLIISKKYIYNFFVNRCSEYLFMPVIEGVPEDVEIVGVDYDFQYDGFSFLLYHESFEIIQQHVCIPNIEIDQEIGFRKSKYKKLSSSAPLRD